MSGEDIIRPHVVVLDDGELPAIAVVFKTKAQAEHFAEHVGRPAKVATIASRDEVIDSALTALGPIAALGVAFATSGAL